MKSITQTTSFGAVAALAILSMIIMPFTTFAATSWELQAPSPVVFSCLGEGILFEHTIDTITQDENGNLEGTGSFDLDGTYTWDLEGTVVGDEIEFSITYTGQALGAVYNLDGVIAEDGSVSGEVDSNCESFTMPAGSLVAVAQDPIAKAQCKNGGWEAFGFKNQGQCVSFVETGHDSREIAE